jgi:hypothetical protein
MKSWRIITGSVNIQLVGAGFHPMTSCNQCGKISIALCSVGLVTGYVMYKAGMLDRFFGSANPPTALSGTKMRQLIDPPPLEKSNTSTDSPNSVVVPESKTDSN